MKNLIRDPCIDWQRVCLNLRRVQSLQKVARQVGADGGTLRRIARGETPEPKFSVGLKLLDLHLDHCPDKHKEITHDGD